MTTTKKHIGETIEIKWGTWDSYGYTTCTLRQNGHKIAACNGGGYDMRGTVIGNWLAAMFPDELRALKEKDMPERSHWSPKRARVCVGVCRDDALKAWRAALAAAPEGTDLPKPPDALPNLPDDCFECPTCMGPTHQSRDGQTVQDGRSFYGLTFHDPNYDPSKAVIGKDCSDRTLTKGDVGSNGKTVGEAESAGNSFGLERLQAIYSASNKHATRRHTVPSIDGGCGISCVMDIARAIGIQLRQVHDSKNLDVYVIEPAPRKDGRRGFKPKHKVAA